jgi:acylphosphatase
VAVRRNVVVHGRVQGVGFRFAIARAAESRGVAGWVRNRPDGTVEAVFEGEPDAVESLVRLSADGPRGAAVERVEVSGGEAEGLATFEIR